MRYIASCFVALLLVGCNLSFKNPLSWKESSSDDSLLGLWELVDDNGTLKISTHRSSGYLFEFHDGENKSSVEVDVLKMGDARVLQFRLSTYRLKGESSAERYSGFSFANIKVSSENELVFQVTDVEAIERLIGSENSNLIGGAECEKKSSTDKTAILSAVNLIDFERCMVLNLSSEVISKLFYENMNSIFSGEELGFKAAIGSPSVPR